MYPGVTEKFLEVTLDAYKKHVGDQFGKRVLGAFTDEPNVRPAGGLPWTDHLPAEFQKRWGYNLLDHLPSLVRPVGNWKQVRHDYFQWSWSSSSNTGQNRTTPGVKTTASPLPVTTGTTNGPTAWA
jgi:hypothetical protein